MTWWLRGHLLEERQKPGEQSSGVFHPAGLARQDQRNGRQLLRRCQRRKQLAGADGAGQIASLIATSPRGGSSPPGGGSYPLKECVDVDRTMDTTSFSKRLRASYSPRLLLSELLLKQWFEPVIPFILMIALLLFCGNDSKYYGFDNFSR